MNPNLRVLTLTHYGTTPEENTKITLAAYAIKMTAARDGFIQDRPIKVTEIYFFEEGDGITLNLSDFDLLQLESVVGAYEFPE